MASSTGTGAGVFQTSPTITTPVISSLSSAASTALTLQSAGTTAITVDTSQRVGIGTTSPSEKLDVQSSGDLKARVYTSGTTVSTHAGLTLKTGSYEYLIQNLTTTASSAGALRFYDITASAERMRIDSSGYVAIAKSPNSLAMLEVRANSGSIYQLFLEQNNTEHGWQFLADQADGYLKFYRRDGSGSTKRFEFQSTGAAYSSTGTWGTLSDARLKENIVDATPKLDAVMQLKVRNYNLIGEDLKQIGFVAQELEQVFPNVAETERNYDGTVKEDGIKSVKTTVLIPILVKAIQELKAINDTQAETINALTARIEALEGK
jgi:hypothetical protein